MIGVDPYFIVAESDQDILPLLEKKREKKSQLHQISDGLSSLHIVFSS